MPDDRLDHAPKEKHAGACKTCGKRVVYIFNYEEQDRYKQARFRCVNTKCVNHPVLYTHTLFLPDWLTPVSNLIL